MIFRARGPVQRPAKPVYENYFCFEAGIVAEQMMASFAKIEFCGQKHRNMVAAHGKCFLDELHSDPIALPIGRVGNDGVKSLDNPVYRQKIRFRVMRPVVSADIAGGDASTMFRKNVGNQMVAGGAFPNGHVKDINMPQERLGGPRLCLIQIIFCSCVV